MMTILFISRWTFFLDYTCLMKTSKLLPHTPMGETPLCASLHISMITMRMASYKHRISSRCSSWTCTSFLHSWSWWCLEGTHYGSLHLSLQDILVIGSNPTRPIFGSLHEHLGHPLISFTFYFFIILMSWRYAWHTTPSYSSRHTCHRINSLMTILRITPWIYWPSLDLIHFATLKPTNGSSIAYGQILQVNLNANISP